MSVEAIGKRLFEVLEPQGRTPEEVAKVRKAYEFASKAHEGQFRKSEDPYIIHPVEVATILAEYNADADTICAGLLHDVLEDCNVSGDEMEKAFGKDVRQIVEGVTKLGKFSFSSKEERQAENFRKLIMAIADDVRVVLVKLIDRLHNMRTLDYMAPNKQKDIAKETLEIYAPLANRFGLGRMKWELEDLGLKYLYPEDFAEIERLVAKSREERESLIEEVVSKFRHELSSKGIESEIVGRPKHLFGIWKKMKRQEKAFEELYDVLAIRIIIESYEDKNYCELSNDPDTQKCYEVMGLVHALFRPIPGRFKDYIAMPKANSYQSLHTAVIGPHGHPIEVQMRTRRMHQVAEYGIAAHWKYKESGEAVTADSQLDRKLSWLRQLVEWQQDLKDAQEYLDTVKMDLFADEVFVFSPRGEVFDLPRGATPIDFAYRIHTDIGHKCIGARINDRIIPLGTELKNGDIVEIITSKNARPRMDWLNIAKTHGAKNRIRQWFKKYHREEHIAQGRQMLEAEFGKSNLDEVLKSENFKEIGRKINLNEVDDIIAAIGYGDISMSQVVNKTRESERKEKSKLPLSAPVQEAKAANVGSLGGLMHYLAKCCSPVPGEEIIGVVTRGSGIAVHRSDCTNLTKENAERQMVVAWSTDRQQAYPATLVIECIDRVGIAGDILKKVSDHKINLQDLRVETHREDKTATITLIIDVSDIEQLNRIGGAIGLISDVIRVQRQDHRKKNGKGTSTNVTPLQKPQRHRPQSKKSE
ncbi:MAG: bifunctional (p)ppGpp synthetase/guanosine-3',5'-bis(diphosphate) 3'-pyrophosphohydrolase [Candidatus Obscuribacterales bacterium]|nr:bifunctional (p)ppGpp synthetase/guanosine-3',5'-bis(diphosphate) 3'-pyrophosphohydrolase [Candidatus Obscuribacterales bacterium]